MMKYACWSRTRLDDQVGLTTVGVGDLLKELLVQEGDAVTVHHGQDIGKEQFNKLDKEFRQQLLENAIVIDRGGW